MVLFTSFDPGMIDLNRTSARAVRDLKHFIEFAERGPRALAEATQGSVGSHESPFEEAVAAALTRKGWTAVPQIGVSRFRIDLGIVHPDRPGDYLLGIECDGATYHSAATARDRDKVRAAILENLGWRLLRVWSTDWWVDRERAAERLHQAILEALEESRRNAEDVTRSTAEGSGGFGDVDRSSGEGERETKEDSTPTFERVATSMTQTGNRQLQLHSSIGAPTLATPLSYRPTDFTSFASVMSPDAFYEPAYRPTLVSLVKHVLDHESPISESLLVERIARAHGFQRSGRVIREAVTQVARRHFHTSGSGGENRFVWPDESARMTWNSFRVPVGPEDVRQIEEIAPEELRAAAEVCYSADRETEIARMFGIRRLSGAARERIANAIGDLRGMDDPNIPSP
jgi:very-short-patch-repair endonuclease